MPQSIARIERLYRTEGAARYGNEAVSQQEHAFQCALLAEQAGSPDALVAACLLHDLGHLLHAGVPGQPIRDELHEYRGLPFLRGEFPDAVLEPIRLHVAAKRFLCAADPRYRASLSPASEHSLQLQGGPHGDAEVERFLAEPFAMQALALRRWDEKAKVPIRSTPGWDHFRRVLERVSLHRPQPALATAS